MDNVNESMLEAIKKLNGYRYEWKVDIEDHKKGDADIGVIAQEVQSIFPELTKDFNGILKVSYNGLVAVLIEAVKELAARVESLEGGASAPSQKE